MVMSLVWQVFEPLLFGLVGAEVSVEYMNSKVVGVLRFPLFLFFLFSFCCSYCSFFGGRGWGTKVAGLQFIVTKTTVSLHGQYL